MIINATGGGRGGRVKGNLTKDKPLRPEKTPKKPEEDLWETRKPARKKRRKSERERKSER
jgi:hypothetical protein